MKINIHREKDTTKQTRSTPAEIGKPLDLSPLVMRSEPATENKRADHDQSSGGRVHIIGAGAIEGLRHDTQQWKRWFSAEHWDGLSIQEQDRLKEQARQWVQQLRSNRKEYRGGWENSMVAYYEKKIKKIALSGLAITATVGLGLGLAQYAGALPEIKTSGQFIGSFIMGIVGLSVVVFSLEALFRSPFYALGHVESLWNNCINKTNEVQLKSKEESTPGGQWLRVVSTAIKTVEEALDRVKEDRFESEASFVQALSLLVSHCSARQEREIEVAWQQQDKKEYWQWSYTTLEEWVNAIKNQTIQKTYLHEPVDAPKSGNMKREEKRVACEHNAERLKECTKYAEHWPREGNTGSPNR